MTTPEDTPDSPQAGIADAFGQLSQQTAALVRQELDAAREELIDKAKTAAAGGALLGGAAVLGAFAAAAGHTLLLRLLDKALPPATAALVRTLLYAGAGTALAVIGADRLRHAQPPYPSRTLDRAAADLQQATGR